MVGAAAVRHTNSRRPSGSNRQRSHVRQQLRPIMPGERQRTAAL
jgi:hypothetical protein